MTLKELKQALAGGADIDAQVLAADPMVYLLQIIRRDQAGDDMPVTLQNERGENLVYRSRYSADQAFAGVGFTRVTLVHESAYGEMVGLEAGSNRMEQSYPVTHDAVDG